MKKIISVCLTLILMLACIPLSVYAEGTPTFAVGTVEAQPGDTVELPVLIENNSGIVALHVIISFDTDVLTLKNVVPTSLFSTGSFTLGGDFNTSPFTIIWDDGTNPNNTTENGAFATLTFEVSEDAQPGDAVVSIDYYASSVFDVNMTNVAFNTRSGAVTIPAPAEPGGWSFSDDCTLYIYEGMSDINYVAGLDVSYPVISDYIKTTGGWSFDVEMNENGMESTGAKLVIYDENNDVVEEYYSVLLGDINGDGVLDGGDITLMLYTMGYTNEEPWADFTFPDESPQALSLDIDHSLNLDGTDMTCLVYAIGNTEDIDQMILKADA